MNGRLTMEQCSTVLELLADFQPAVVYVFGSHGTEVQRPDSDIDLAFLADRAVDPVACFEVSNILADRLGRSVDLVDLRRASTVLAKEVIRTGDWIDVRDSNARDEFEMLTLSQYARLNEERQPILTAGK